MHWLFVDASYFIFFRYYALLSWYRRANPTAPTPPPACPLFRSKLLRRVDETLRLLAQSYAPDNIVFCFDGHNNWRKQYYAPYKSSRVHNDTVSALFTACVHHIRDEHCRAEHTQRSFALEHADLEADDIVHFLTRELVTAADSDSKDAVRITIIANDHDYIPLLQLPNVSIIDLKQKSICCPCNIPLPHFLLVKILAGDKSDNIPPIFPRCGPKTALRLASNPDCLRRKLDENTAWQKNFERNTALIDNTQLQEEHRMWLWEQLVRLTESRKVATCLGAVENG